jgi:hypothetical protein
VIISTANTSHIRLQLVSTFPFIFRRANLSELSLRQGLFQSAAGCSRSEALYGQLFNLSLACRNDGHYTI